MTDKKKAVFNFIFLILVFSLTVYMVFKGEDLGEIISTVQQANAVYDDQCDLRGTLYSGRIRDHFLYDEDIGSRG